MAYFVALACACSGTLCGHGASPGRRGLFAALAYPVGWAAGELPVRPSFSRRCWWGSSGGGAGRSDPLARRAGALSRGRRGAREPCSDSHPVPLASVVRRAMEHASRSAAAYSRARARTASDRWWRTALQIPLHPRDMQLRRNVPYGPLARHRLDVWRLSTTPKDAPVIFYVHGGAWTFGDKREQGRPMLHEFVRRGWVVVACNYRLAPSHPWPAQIEDATRALGWIKKNVATYGGDPTRGRGRGWFGRRSPGVAAGAQRRRPQWRPPEMSDVTDWSRARRALVLRRARDDGRRDALARPRERACCACSNIAWCSCPSARTRGLYDTLTLRPHARGLASLLRRPGRQRHLGGRATWLAPSWRSFARVAFAPIYYVELPFTQHAFDLTASPRTSATTRAAVAFAESVGHARPTLSRDSSRAIRCRRPSSASSGQRRVARRTDVARRHWSLLRRDV